MGLDGAVRSNAFVPSGDTFRWTPQGTLELCSPLWCVMWFVCQKSTAGEEENSTHHHHIDARLSDYHSVLPFFIGKGPTCQIP